jgi:hypothetical protein
MGVLVVMVLCKEEAPFRILGMGSQTSAGGVESLGRSETAGSALTPGHGRDGESAMPWERGTTAVVSAGVDSGVIA